MTIRVALNPRDDLQLRSSRQCVAARNPAAPAPHCRTPINSYSLTITPKHFINWQQDPFGNWLARLVFPDKTTELKVTVDLVADMTVINPFDFFVEKIRRDFSLRYPDDLLEELRPFLETDTPARCSPTGCRFSAARS